MALVCLMVSSNIGLAQGKDYENHWAENSIQSWVDKGYVKGYADGSFKPEGDITRAEFISIVNRSFGFTEQAEVSYKDVKPSHWAYGEFKRASAAKYIGGFEDGTMRPNSKITRQEVASIMSRLLNLPDAQMSEKFLSLKDVSQIPQWSAGPVSAVVDKGYMNLRNDSFKGALPATRAEVISALDKSYMNAIAIKYDKPGTYTAGVVNGNVEISAKGVILENTTINGNLIISEGVESGEVTLKNVTIKGDTIVKGGGMNTITLQDSFLRNLIVNKKDGKVRILAKGSTDVSSVDLQSGAKLESSDKTANNFGDLVVSPNLAASAPIILAANFRNVAVQSANNAIQVQSGIIKNLEIAKTAKDALINLAEGVKVDRVEVNAPTKIDGKGKIETAAVNVSGSVITAPTTNVEKSEGVEVKTETPSTPSGGGGGGGGGGSTTPAVDNTALTNAIIAATTNKGTAVVSTDGANIAPANKWVTKAVMDAYTVAIAEAQAVADKSNTTQQEVNDAVTALATATTIFDAAKRDETKPAALESIAVKTPATKLVYTVGEELDITGLVIEGTYSDASKKDETITVANVTGFDSTSAVASQTLTVTVDGKTTTYTVEIKVAPNQDQDAPTGLTGVAPTVAGNDGKITGTTADMEYKLASAEDDTYATCSDTETVVAEAGEYVVRLAAKEGFNAGAPATVKVPAYEAPEVTETDVKNLEELTKALENENIKTINIKADIEANAPVKVQRAVTINGGDHTLSFTGLESITGTEDDGLIIFAETTVNNLTVNAGLGETKSKWVGTYAIHVYNTKAILNNVKATGGNGGILVNGSDVTLTGDIDVSHNGFGGIEVSLGTDLTQVSLNVTGATLKNDSEAYGLPTIWEDKVTGKVTGGTFTTNDQVKENQVQYYVVAENAVAPEVPTPDKSIYEITMNASGMVAKEAKTVPVTLAAKEVKDEGYSKVRVNVAITNKPSDASTVSLMATDTNGAEFDVAQVGYWGPSAGFAISNNYSVETNFTGTFSEAGDYTIVLTLYDVEAENAIVTKTVNVGVQDPTSAEPDSYINKGNELTESEGVYSTSFTWGSTNGIGSEEAVTRGDYSYHDDGAYLRFQVKNAAGEVVKFADVFQTIDDRNNANGGMTLQTNSGNINDMDGSNREKADWGVAGFEGYATNLSNSGNNVFYGLIQDATIGTKTVGFASDTERTIVMTLMPKADLAPGTYTVTVEVLQQGGERFGEAIEYTFVVEGK